MQTSWKLNQAFSFFILPFFLLATSVVLALATPFVALGAASSTGTRRFRLTTGSSAFVPPVILLHFEQGVVNKEVYVPIISWLGLLVFVVISRYGPMLPVAFEDFQHWVA